MANSFTGINETIILQDVFQAFKDTLTPVTGFSTSFDAEARKRGEKISVPVATARTAASRTDGATYEVATGNTVAVADVTLNQQYHVPWYVTDGENAKTMVDLWTSGMRESATALAKSIYQSLLGVFVLATYGDVAGTSKLVQAASGFDLDDLVDLDRLLALVEVEHGGQAVDIDLVVDLEQLVAGRDVRGREELELAGLEVDPRGLGSCCRLERAERVGHATALIHLLFHI
jgi:hypothetical protein